MKAGISDRLAMGHRCDASKSDFVETNHAAAQILFKACGLTPGPSKLLLVETYELLLKSKTSDIKLQKANKSFSISTGRCLRRSPSLRWLRSSFYWRTCLFFCRLLSRRNTDVLKFFHRTGQVGVLRLNLTLELKVYIISLLFWWIPVINETLTSFIE